MAASLLVGAWLQAFVLSCVDWLIWQKKEKGNMCYMVMVCCYVFLPCYYLLLPAAAMSTCCYVGPNALVPTSFRTCIFVWCCMLFR